MTAVRYPEALTAADMRAVNQKLRKAIEDEGRLTRLEGDWWQHSLTVRSEREPSAISLLRISRDREGGLEIAGRAWQEDGTLSARYWSEASKERRDPHSVLYFWKGERPRHRTRPSSKARARSVSSPPIGRRATGPPGPPPTPPSRADVRRLPARRSRRHAHPRRRRPAGARRAARAPPPGVEVDLERVGLRSGATLGACIGRSSMPPVGWMGSAAWPPRGTSG